MPSSQKTLLSLTTESVTALLEIGDYKPLVAQRQQVAAVHAAFMNQCISIFDLELSKAEHVAALDLWWRAVIDLARFDSCLRLDFGKL